VDQHAAASHQGPSPCCGHNVHAVAATDPATKAELAAPCGCCSCFYQCPIHPEGAGGEGGGGGGSRQLAASPPSSSPPEAVTHQVSPTRHTVTQPTPGNCRQAPPLVHLVVTCWLQYHAIAAAAAAAAVATAAEGRCAEASRTLPLTRQFKATCSNTQDARRGGRVAACGNYRRYDHAAAHSTHM
jgi:hypothetical protein